MPEDSETSQLSVTPQPSPRGTVLVVTGELDLLTVGDFHDALRRHLADGPVVLDLSGVTFMDSAAVHALDAVLRDADAHGRRLTVRPEFQYTVRKVLELTGVIEVLEIEDP